MLLLKIRLASQLDPSASRYMSLNPMMGGDYARWALIGCKSLYLGTWLAKKSRATK